MHCVAKWKGCGGICARNDENSDPAMACVHEGGKEGGGWLKPVADAIILNAVSLITISAFVSFNLSRPSLNSLCYGHRGNWHHSRLLGHGRRPLFCKALRATRSEREQRSAPRRPWQQDEQ